VEHCSICAGNHATEVCDTAIRQTGGAPIVAAARDEDRTGIEIGDSVGNYRLMKLIGEGATSRVFLAEHQVIASKVAVKVLRAKLHRHDEIVRRFVGEARATNLVLHENIVQIYDIGQHNGWQYYFVMEYLRGTTLARKIGEGPVPIDEAAPLLIQICDALNAAHANGVIHRDLKPENIFLVPRGDGAQVKVVDFGVARRVLISEGEERTSEGTVLGTASHMAPEQSAGKDVDGRADVYSLGVIMFQLATGHLPFEADSIALLMLAHAAEPPPSPRSLNPDVSPQYEQVILRCLAKAPADRYQTMAELGRAILYAQKKPTLPTPTPTPLPPQAANHAVRFLASFDVQVESESAGQLGTCRAVDISAGGIFVAVPKGVALPTVFSRVRVTIPRPNGPVELEGEVVRVEAPTEDDLGARRGFGVRFDALDEDRRRALDTLLGSIVPIKPSSKKPIPATPSAGPVAMPPASEQTGDPELSRLLAHFELRGQDDPYALLGVAASADVARVRNASRHLDMELSPARFPAMSPTQRDRLTALRKRVALAEEMLVDPVQRAKRDAEHSNFVGVARCISAGLSVPDLSRLRKDHLKTRRWVEMQAATHVAEADDLELRGEVEAALATLAKALELDPLNLLLQRRFWDLRRGGSGAKAD
jgi:eukaryotic-like serine/threonine-protein kinase